MTVAALTGKLRQPRSHIIQVQCITRKLVQVGRISEFGLSEPG
jgi:hypothetical protein